MTKLKPTDPKPNFSSMEEEVLSFWETHKIFEKSLDKTANGKPFVFFEGPPGANGKPGIHHIEARAFKDLIPRYQTMRGRFVERKAGWDTHGLPVELQVEKELGISGKKQIESIKDNVRDSIIEFNRLCKGAVWQYKEEWERVTKRMGYWVNLEDAYVTYHNSYIESVWYVLKQIWDKGLIYSGHKVLPYCPRCGTALSSHEVALGYKTVKDNSVYVKFRLKEEGQNAEVEGRRGKVEVPIYILSWTTTPWTLPGNIALAVGQDIDYVKVEVDSEIWILAKERLEVLKDNDHKVVGNIKGKDLVGLEYEPLFDVPDLKSDKSYKVYAADFVTTTDGTGVVHTAVMYGEDDYNLGEQIGLPKFHTVDEAGHFVPQVKDLAGMYVKGDKAENKIFELLGNNVLRVEQYEHEYPHCWRCSTALLYYARDSWFIKMSAMRTKLQENNDQINWVPEHIKHGRFGEWLKDAKDWAISRERYWGTPLPFWQCTKCGNHQAVGSSADLKLSSNLFYFARHGQAQSNVLGIHSNYPEATPRDLTELGVFQAKQMAEKIKERGGVDVIYASDLLRTKHTAEIVGKFLNIPVVFDERLREYNLGEFNGRKLEDFHAEYPLADRWSKAPKGGETYEDVQGRVLDFVHDVNGKLQNKRVLVVTHGDVLWLLQQYYEVKKEYPKYAEFFDVYIGLPDLHRPYIDDVVLACDKCGAESHRVSGVLDVWFDSGAMPYAQHHYPFENRDKLDGANAQFPADYISEAVDQTRGWFYTLLAISTLLDRGPAFKNVINLGHVFDAKGQKMSKSKGNVIDPWSIMDKQGIDALRWYMYSVNQPGDSKLFNEKDLDLIVRKQFMTLWNVLSFLTTYANFADWDPTEYPTENIGIMDKWILIRTQELVNEVTDNLDHYNIFKAVRSIEEFINVLSTWYVRRSRDAKGQALYQTLYQVLRTLAQLMSPFAPFLAEKIWEALRQDSDAESVHLTDWPQTQELSSVEKEILQDMELAQQIVERGHAARKAQEIKVRQPLAKLEYSANRELGSIYEPIVLSELNIKQLKFKQAADKDSSAVAVELDTKLTKELEIEGLARDLERAVQGMRKDSGLNVGDLVTVSFASEDEDVAEAFAMFDKNKTFVQEIQQHKADDAVEHKFGQHKVWLSIKGK